MGATEALAYCLLAAELLNVDADPMESDPGDVGRWVGFGGAVVP